MHMAPTLKEEPPPPRAPRAWGDTIWYNLFHHVDSMFVCCWGIHNLHTNIESILSICCNCLIYHTTKDVVVVVDVIVAVVFPSFPIAPHHSQKVGGGGAIWIDVSYAQVERTRMSLAHTTPIFFLNYYFYLSCSILIVNRSCSVTPTLKFKPNIIFHSLWTNFGQYKF